MILVDNLLQRVIRLLWLMCESPLTDYYERTGFIEAKMPSLLFKTSIGACASRWVWCFSSRKLRSVYDFACAAGFK
jgi:hypothetical protein